MLFGLFGKVVVCKSVLFFWDNLVLDKREGEIWVSECANNNERDKMG